MSTKPLVAVILRTKDRPLFLERALKSIVDQTFKNFVVVVVNDGGKPKPVDDLVKKYALGDRAKVIHNETSGGMWVAANKGIDSIDSEYVILHDDDDSWHPEFLKMTTDYLNDTGADGVVTVTDKVIEEVTENSIKTHEKSRLFPGLKFISFYKMCLENYATPIAFLYRRSILKDVGYYDQSIGGVGDWDFALRFLTHSEINFLQTEKALAYYHQRPDATGAEVNSVFTDAHRAYENIIANRYLRDDLAKGKFGLGYIISSLRHDFETDHRLREVMHQGRLDDREYLRAMLEQSDQRVTQLENLLIHYIQQSSPLNLKSSVRRGVRKVKRTIVK